MSTHSPSSPSLNLSTLTVNIPHKKFASSRYGASIVSLPDTGGIAQSLPTKTRAQRFLSPCFINRLPNELLCIIFMMCGDPNTLFAYPRDERMDPTSTSIKTHSYIRATVTLGCVCSRWYSITRGTPQLWTIVDIALPQPCDIKALRLSLEYSKGLPLTLRINGYDYTPPPRRNTTVCVNLMQLVADHARRWREISIIMKHEPPRVSDLVAPLLELPRDSYISLERAMLRFHEDDKQHPAASRLWEKFYDSPALRVVQWHRLLRVNPPPSVLRQLTHVGVTVILPDDIMSLLRACPHVEVLQAIVTPAPHLLPGREDGHLIPLLPMPILLPCLHTLSLGGMYNWSNFFGGLTAPCIRRLEMAVAGVQADAIRAMLRRSDARLIMLAFRWLWLGNEDNIIALLQSPEMQHLRIFCYDPHYRRKGRDGFDPSLYLPYQVIAYAQWTEQVDCLYRDLTRN